MDEPLTTAMVPTALGTVRCARAGDFGLGRPPLVFVHGYPDNLQIWSRVVPLLAESHPVLAFDWPGLGHSEARPSGGATPFHLARELVALADALDLDQMIPVGFDMGAHAVAVAAHRHPDRFPRLVFTNFLALGDVETSWDISIMRRLGLNQVFLGRAPQLVFRRAERTFLTRGQSLPAAVREDLWSGFRQAHVRDRLVKMCAGYQAALDRVAALYSEIEQPTLVLWADDDGHFPAVQGEEFARRLPKAELQELEGLRHWFMWQSPEPVARAIDNFATR